MLLLILYCLFNDGVLIISTVYRKVTSGIFCWWVLYHNLILLHFYIFRYILYFQIFCCQKTVLSSTRQWHFHILSNHFTFFKSSILSVWNGAQKYHIHDWFFWINESTSHLYNNLEHKKSLSLLCKLNVYVHWISDIRTTHG